MKRPAEQRRKLPPELEAFARSQDDKLRIRRPRVDKGLVRDPREGYTIAGVSNRDARAVYDVRAEAMRALWAGGAASEVALRELGELLHDALRLELWRARRVTGFAAFAEQVLGIPIGRADDLAQAAAARAGEAPAPLSERAVALWLRTEAGLYEGDVRARVRVRNRELGLVLELALPLAEASTALAGAGARHLPLARAVRAGDEGPGADPVRAAPPRRVRSPTSDLAGGAGDLEAASAALSEAEGRPAAAESPSAAQNSQSGEAGLPQTAPDPRAMPNPNPSRVAAQHASHGRSAPRADQGRAAPQAGQGRAGLGRAETDARARDGLAPRRADDSPGGARLLTRKPGFNGDAARAPQAPAERWGRRASQADDRRAPRAEGRGGQGDRRFGAGRAPERGSGSQGSHAKEGDRRVERPAFAARRAESRAGSDEQRGSVGQRPGKHGARGAEQLSRKGKLAKAGKGFGARRPFRGKAEPEPKRAARRDDDDEE